MQPTILLLKKLSRLSISRAPTYVPGLACTACPWPWPMRAMLTRGQVPWGPIARTCAQVLRVGAAPAPGMYSS